MNNGTMGHVWDIVYNENSPKFPAVVLIIARGPEYRRDRAEDDR